MLTYFDPPPARAELPARFPSPFATQPHPIARRAADELRGALAQWDLEAPGAGKMFGVLVVEDAEGRIGYLRAFSGMLDGRWLVEGFAPPAFDLAARAAFWPDGEAELGAYANKLAAIDREAEPLRAELARVDASQAAERAAVRARLAANRADRRAVRETGDAAGAALDDAARHALDQASRADTAEKRTLRAAHREAREELAAQVAALDAARGAIDRARAERSRQLLERLQDTYELANARGERRSLRALFAPAEPPGGAGDCAAPKLLAQAYRQGLRPIALAELWWGAPPLTGGRHTGRFYPACRGKCEPILAQMLEGIDAEPAPVYGAGVVRGEVARGAWTAFVAAEDRGFALRIVYEDDWLVVVDKPAGLLTVPGRTPALADSVLTRLRARYPDHPELLVAHRLDLDTSGLVVAAKDRATHAGMQRMFAAREVDKRYAAILEGTVRGDRGVIELPLRVDLDDRPRQIYDPVHGKPAVTEWCVIARLPEGRTRVELVPRTGRTHQLRVHAAHPLGLDTPIVGDRLYGRSAGDGPLLLRAEWLAFEHPARPGRVTITA